MSKILSLFVLIYSALTLAQYDFQPLKDLKNKKLIAIGESGHGVAAFHQVRTALSKYFIEKAGFRNIIIESNFLESFLIDEALQLCQKPDYDPKVVNKAFSILSVQTYRHKEFFEFYQFLCTWNNQHPKDPVHLLGMDVWSFTWDIRKFLVKTFNDIGLDNLTTTLLTATNQCFLWNLENLKDYPTHPDWVYYEKYFRVQPERHLNCLAALKSLQGLVNNNKSTIIEKVGENQFIKILMSLDTGLTNQLIRDVYEFDFSKAMNLRDATQAKNTLQLQSIVKNQAPTLYLAHNLHVFQKMSQVLPGTNDSDYAWSHVTSSGEWLKAHFGDSMSVIGLGGYNLQSLRDGQYPIPQSKDSIDFTLHQMGKKFELLNIHQKPWKNKFWRVHNESDAAGLWVNLEKQCDYYFFVDQSGPATAY